MVGQRHGQRGSQAQPSNLTPGLTMPLMRTATMKSRQAEAALADAGAPGGRSGEEYLMWCAALRQERADKHTAVITTGVEQHRAVVRVGAAWVRVFAGRTVDAGVAPDFDHVLAGRTVDAVTGFVADGRVWRTRTDSCSNQGVTSEFSHQVLLPPPLSATTCQQGCGPRGANGIGRATQTHTRG